MGDPEAPRASGQKPGDAVVDVATAGASALALGPLCSVPVRGPKPVLPPYPGGCRELLLPSPVLASLGPGPDAARLKPSPTVWTRYSSAVFFPRTASEGASSSHARPAPERSGPARERPLVEVQGAYRGPSRRLTLPPIGPLARFFLMQSAVH